MQRMQTSRVSDLHVICTNMIEFYSESDITDLDNKKLMELLQLCFPMLKCFETNRFYLERSDFRWLIRNSDRIIANAVVHDKIFLSDEKRISKRVAV